MRMLAIGWLATVVVVLVLLHLSAARADAHAAQTADDDLWARDLSYWRRRARETARQRLHPEPLYCGRAVRHPIGARSLEFGNGSRPRVLPASAGRVETSATVPSDFRRPMGVLRAEMRHPDQSAH